MGWDGIWDGLGNEKNWDSEKYRAQTALLAVEDFHKHWDRYASSSYFAPEYLRRQLQASIRTYCVDVTRKLRKTLWNVRVSRGSSCT